MEPIELFDAEGNAVKAYSEEAFTTKEKELQDALVEKAKLSADFGKMNNLTEEEKAAKLANESELLKRIDLLQAEVEGTKTSQRDSLKNANFARFHGNNEDIKKSLEEKYAIINLPESTPEEIQARVEAAATLAGISVDNRNPIHQYVTGEAPRYHPPKDDEESAVVTAASAKLDEMRNGGVTA